MEADHKDILKVLESIEWPAGWSMVGDRIHLTPQAGGGYKSRSMRLYLEHEDGDATISIGIGWDYKTDPGGAFPDV
jgi:hypothetical protein